MIAGLKVGHATDARLKSGVTAIIPERPSVAAVHVAGGAPATRETDLLLPGNSVDEVDAILLCGGSAFGLAAADGAMQWLAERGRGFALGDFRVPIVPAAALFDLANGGDKSVIAGSAGGSVYRTLGMAACEAAAEGFGLGATGAGAGATTADLKGGFGSAEARTPQGGRVAAFAAVNAVGRATLGATAHFRAAPFERDAEFGGLGLPARLPGDAAAVVIKGAAKPGQNTTLVVVATDCALTRNQARRLAIAAHDGIALAIYPAHTPFDGDIAFALATAARPLGAEPRALLELCAAATAAVARSIAIGVYAAEAAPGDRVPAWRERYGGQDIAAGEH